MKHDGDGWRKYLQGGCAPAMGEIAVMEVLTAL
jgi:hypothetical protein